MLRQAAQAAGRLAVASNAINRLVPQLSCALIAAGDPLGTAAAAAARSPSPLPLPLWASARRGLATEAAEAWDSLRQSFTTIKAREAQAGGAGSGPSVGCGAAAIPVAAQPCRSQPAAAVQ